MTDRKDKEWHLGRNSLNDALNEYRAILQRTLGEEVSGPFTNVTDCSLQLLCAIRRTHDEVVRLSDELKKAERANGLLRTDLHSANVEADRLRKLLRIVRRVTKLAEA